MASLNGSKQQNNCRNRRNRAIAADSFATWLEVMQYPHSEEAVSSVTTARLGA